MGADDWYRMSEWTEEGAAFFEKKIARARSQKAQYLTIQAYHLLGSRPDVSLELLDRAEEADVERWETARIQNFRAEAKVRMKDRGGAIATYKDAMRAQRRTGAIFTSAALDFAFYVSYHRMSAEYPQALRIMALFPGGLTLETNAQVLGAMALVLEDLRDRERELRTEAYAAVVRRRFGDASSLARKALGILDTLGVKTEPGQRKLGDFELHEFQQRLERIAIG